MKFTFNRETKNTIRFDEVKPNDDAAPVIGTLYVNKSVLKDMNWTPNKTLEVTIKVEGM